MFRPKKPSSHSMNRITMIVHNMRFLLLNDLLEATRCQDRVAFELTVQQDENSSRDGEDRQDQAQAT
jgi:transposase